MSTESTTVSDAVSMGLMSNIVVFDSTAVTDLPVMTTGVAASAPVISTALRFGASASVKAMGATTVADQRLGSASGGPKTQPCP